jgi:hypothetical protein
LSEQSRRKRFQIHLSTAVLLMLAAGAIVWANVKERPWGERFIIRGWPLDWMEYWGMSGKDYSLLGIPCDIVVAALLLFAVWFVCEWWIRRRAART